MTRNVAIVVEGQTEEAFVAQVLGPFVGWQVHLQPIITHTSRTAAGAHRGGGGWNGYRDRLRRLVKESHWDLVTTMIDFYGYPHDAPGHDCHESGSHRQPDCLHHRVAAMADSITGRWRPFLMVHEFEALVIAAASTRVDVLGEPRVGAHLAHLVDEYGGAEMINDGPTTAPSKRLQELLPKYRKRQDAIAILQTGDFADVLRLCPTFAAWVDEVRG